MSDGPHRPPAPQTHAAPATTAVRSGSTGQSHPDRHAHGDNRGGSSGRGWCGVVGVMRCWAFRRCQRRSSKKRPSFCGGREGKAELLTDIAAPAAARSDTKKRATLWWGGPLILRAASGYTGCARLQVTCGDASQLRDQGRPYQEAPWTPAPAHPPEGPARMSGKAAALTQSVPGAPAPGP